jgi:hypothetical protein
VIRSACATALLGWVFSALLSAWTPAHAAARGATTAADPVEVRIGEEIYLHGVLASGNPLQAVRTNGVPGATGAQAACVNCHRRSGLGSPHQTSGTGTSISAVFNRIPPVAGRYLFQHNAGRAEDNLPYVDGMRSNRSPYTPETLARALRTGIDSDGRTLDNLMPHFAIDDANMAALIAYLNTLFPARVPGVTPGVLHFATIITPEAEPARRSAMLDVMEKFFAERNARQMVPSAALRASGKTQYGRSMFMVHRQWQLHVWELSGPASGWGEQLEHDLAREPVLAVLSGLGHNWAPIHAFCERQRLACLFPNTELPVDGPQDFFELYLSRGVLLEADLIASGLTSESALAPIKTVQQIYRAGDSGEPAARALADRLRESGIAVRESVVGRDGRRDVADALKKSAGVDALVLWLRPAELSALGDTAAAPPVVYMSGMLGGLENSTLPASWRERTRMAYPFDLPKNRTVRVDYPLGWFRISRIPVVDEQMQADTYLTLGLVSEGLKELVDTFYGPYLIEYMQSMVEHRIVTGYYPRLTLAENQHFASKGGYLVRFAQPTGTRLIADSEWIVP